MSQGVEEVGKTLPSLLPSPPCSGCRGVLGEEGQTGTVHSPSKTATHTCTHAHTHIHTQQPPQSNREIEIQSASGQLSSLVRS